MASSYKDIVYQMQSERFKIFTSQDLENGNFDVKFVIEEKIIYAHKFILTPISETMDSWLSDRWSNKDAPIKIESYSYENFYRFLRFLYIGHCALTNENVFQMVDLAEFFAVPLLKELCDKFLATKYSISTQNFEKLYDFGETYSLPFFTESIKKFIYEKGDAIISENNFSSFKKPFVQFFSVAIRRKFKEEFFEAAYTWAERHVVNKAPNHSILEAIKTELYTIIPHPDFCKMEKQFLMNFVVEKGFYLSHVQLCQIFKSFDHNTNEQYKFKFMYDLAQKQGTRIALEDTTFDLAYYTKSMLKEIIPHVNFCFMDKQFLMDFVLENGFHLSPTEFCRISYIQTFENEQQKFKYLFELSEKQATKKQSIATKNVVSFNLADTIKADLVPVMPWVNFYKMDKQFLIDFVFEKGFFLSSTEFYRIFKSLISLDNKQRFEYVYELAEKQALKKQSIAAKNGGSFNIFDAIKSDLAKVIPIVNFYEMDKQFLIDFVLEKGFILSPTEFYRIFQFLKSPNKKQSFEYVSELAEKQALKKQLIAAKNGESFNISDSIKTDLAEILQKNKDLVNNGILDLVFENSFYALVGLSVFTFLFFSVLKK